MTRFGRWLVWNWRRLPLWGIRKYVLGQRVVIEKDSGSELVSRLREWLQSDSPAVNTEFLADVAEQLDDMASSLAGKTVRTYHRLEFKEMDAVEAYTALSTRNEGRALLAKLVELTEPRHVVEFGSAFGVGSLVIAKSIESAPRSSFTGIEFEEWKADLANELVKPILGDRGRILHGAIEDVFPRVVEETPARIGLAFVDAEHTYRATRRYHDLLSPVLCEGAVVVYDDILWSPGMMRFWDELVSEATITDALVIDGQWGVVRYSANLSS